MINEKMIKRVNIYAPNPVKTINPPVRGRIRGTKMRVADIRKCIMGRAIVEEVLKDGSTVLLTLANYDKINEPVVEEITPVEEIKENEPVVETSEPVVEEKVENDTIKAIKEKVAARKAKEVEEKAVEESKEEAKVEDTKEVVKEETSVEEVEESAEVIEEVAEEETIVTKEEGEDTLPETDEDGLEIMDVSTLGL